MIDLAGLHRALHRLRHPQGAHRVSDFLAMAAAVKLIEEEARVGSDPAFDQRVADLGGLPRRLVLTRN